MIRCLRFYWCVLFLNCVECVLYRSYYWLVIVLSCMCLYLLKMTVYKNVLNSEIELEMSCLVYCISVSYGLLCVKSKALRFPFLFLPYSFIVQCTSIARGTDFVIMCNILLASISKLLWFLINFRLRLVRQTNRDIQNTYIFIFILDYEIWVNPLWSSCHSVQICSSLS